MGCKNKVTQYVERGFGFREIKSPCGSTGIHGEQLVCSECQTKMGEQYPQGWRHTPGDICPHGNYVGDAGGPDYICGLCENGL